MSFSQDISKLSRDESKSGKILDLILLAGAGDIIYSFYKLSKLVNEGYLLNIFSPSEHPQRAHQLQHILPGINSFNYIDVPIDRYRMIQIDNILDPPEKSLFQGKPVLHINSFLENGFHIDSYIPSLPCNYNLEFKNIPETSVLDQKNFNVILYCSNYNNNRNCSMHPDPYFWIDLVSNIFEDTCQDKPLKITLIGAQYDLDLTNDCYELCKTRKISSDILIDKNFGEIIDIIKKSDLCICYESGFGMICDILKKECIEIFRRQGHPRDDKLFPFLGALNPDSINKWIFPFFYDDSSQEIVRKFSLRSEI